MESVLIPLEILIPIAVGILALIGIMIFLHIKNKRFSQKIIEEKNKIIFYNQQIEELKNSKKTPEQDLQQLDETIRRFFNDYYNLNFSMPYLELAKHFQKINKPEYARFCQTMSAFKYYGKKIHPLHVKQLIAFFEKVVEIENN